jgi:hypothetical protein
MLDPVVNFGKVTVSTGYDSDDVSIVLSSGDGAKLPQPSTDGAFNLVWWNVTDYADPADDPNVEIVRVTARSTDTLTVTRAQEGTSGSTKNTGSKTYKMALGITKKTIDDIDDGYTTNVDFAAGSYFYRGDADVGSSGSDPVWRIRKVFLNSNNNGINIVFADGDTNFDNIWDNRATLVYSFSYHDYNDVLAISDALSIAVV